MLKRSINFLQFSYSTLEKATESFNEAFRLGQGGYGEVFKVFEYVCVIILALSFSYCIAWFLELLHIFAGNLG